MTPYELAIAVYDKEPCARTFEEDLRLHLLNGYVFNRPDFFVMGRGVCSTAPSWAILDPSITFHPDLWDCWHVYLFASPSVGIAPVFDIMPRPLPLVSFERKNELRFLSLSSIRRLSGVA